MKINRTRKKIYLFGTAIFMWLYSLIIIIPLLMVLLNSLKSSGEADTLSLALPRKFMFENYLVVLVNGRFMMSLFNSTVITVASMILTLVLSAMGAYVISRRKSNLNNFFRNIFLIGLIIPLQMVPLIRVLQFFHLMNSFQGITIVYTAAGIPFTVFLVYGFFSSIPRDMDEAAIIDGVGPLSLFFRIIFPLLKPVMVTAGVLVFVGNWNNFQLPLYILTSSRKWPLPLSVFDFYGRYSSDWNLVCAHITLTTLPIVIIYLIGQKYIISGMTAGAVKG